MIPGGRDEIREDKWRSWRLTSANIGNAAKSAKTTATSGTKRATTRRRGSRQRRHVVLINALPEQFSQAPAGAYVWLLMNGF
jgi:hypothetical protein